MTDATLNKEQDHKSIAMTNKELTRIVADYGQYMMDFIGRSVENIQDREDILQETWLILAKRGTDRIDHNKLCGYLRSVALSAKAEYYRKVSQSVFTKYVADYQFERIEPAFDKYMTFEAEYFHKAVRHAARHLSPKYRGYVTSYFIDGKSLVEIAYRANVGVEAVRTPINAFVPELRRVFKQYV